MRRLATNLLALLALTAPLAAGALEVVATSTSLGALVREIAPGAQLKVLAPPNRDLHALQVKPSMIRALRGADLVVAVGAELEVGWLPPAIASAANPRILPGRSGYFEAAAQVDLLDRGLPADRALGDVHPMGNPHVNLDPVRMARVGLALAGRLAELDPAGAGGYRSRAEAFAAEVERRLPGWQRRTADAPGAVLYHRDALYLLDRLAVPLLGEIEPIPGVPPSAAHLKGLIDGLSGRRGVILYTPYQPPREPRRLAEAIGWPSLELPIDPPEDGGGPAYLDLVARWVDAIAQGK